MKIGIVTRYNGANMGAYLQAYALKKYLEGYGHSVSYIRINNVKNNRVFFYRWFSKMWLKDAKYTINYIRFGKEKFNYFKNSWKEFTVADAKQKFDIVILGSDEIWNAGNSIFRNPLYYGVGVNAYKVISYAASIGNYKGSNLPNYVPEAINRLGAVLVRDEATKEFAEKYTNKPVNIVCDPTLLYDFESQTFPNCSDRYIYNNKYILIYAYNYSETEKNWIKTYAKEQQLKIVTVGFYQNWCDHCVNCEPLEFLSVIKNAEIIFTSSFHCGIFSIYLHKRMVIRPSGQKVRDFFKRIGGEAVLIKNEESYDRFKQIAESKLDFQEIFQNIYSFRMNSSQLLQNSLLSSGTYK
ncbi:MAG TPA: polysaccharide pyruvyl transferase family protein [Peptococcaceae bacterium]|nr:polysaccharide pyruvyl transferase family protein [Peptococcaceae bacterium]